MSEFERGFLSKPRVKALLARFDREDEEARIIAARNEDIYTRAIRNYFLSRDRKERTGQ